MILQPQDKETLAARGITEEKLREELSDIKNGFPYLDVVAPATSGNGIMVTTPEQRKEYSETWRRFLADGGKVMKMTPASGAASRMFKKLFEFADGESSVPDNDFIRRFADGITSFAFYPELDATVRKLHGKGVAELFAEGRHRDVVRALIMPEGMNYGQLPKALLAFHAYPSGVRTALEEHLAEGAQFAAGADGKVRVHFTVSPEHRELMRVKIDEATPTLEKEFGVTFETGMSEQKPSTDTVAANPDGTPYREDGKLFFRPGGHGALIENLNDLSADVIFLKNIDNVVPDSRRDSTIEYKMLLGGILVSLRERIERYAGMLREGMPSRPVLNEMLDFLRDTLCIIDDTAAEMDELELADYIYCKLDRPLRVCGMVRNQGEPGGGPFLVRNDEDGTVQPQILESTQIDPNNDMASEAMKHATHFNPVDLAVCPLDLADGKYDLRDYTDPTTGFISQKSRKGHDILALELPGLWNGAMSDWNTVFVEVPADTFNPVKTVNDLLRPAHLG